MIRELKSGTNKVGCGIWELAHMQLIWKSNWINSTIQTIFFGTTAMWAFASIMDHLQTLGPRPHFWFPNSFLRGGVINPTPNPQPGGPGPIFITPGTVWPSCTLRHRVPILVAFYNMHGLQRSYYLIPVPHGIINSADLVIPTGITNFLTPRLL